MTSSLAHFTPMIPSPDPAAQAPKAEVATVETEPEVFLGLRVEEGPIEAEAKDGKEAQ